MITLRQLIELISTDYVQDMFSDHGEVAPVFFGLDPNQKMTVVTIGGTPEGGLEVEPLREIARQRQMTMCVTVFEAWGLSTAERPSDEILRRGIPRDHPDREEIVMFSGEGPDEYLMGRRRIVRTPGHDPCLGPLEIVGARRSEGHMIGLLPRPEGMADN